MSEPTNTGLTDPSRGRLVPLAQNVPATPGYGRGGYPEEIPGGSEFSLNFHEYWRILKKRKWLILSLAGAFVALSLLITLMTTPLYTATARLQIDRNVGKIVEGGSVTPVEGADFEFMKTQYELLLGRSMAERVASSLKLGDDPDFLKPREFSILGAIRGLFASKAPVDNEASGKSSRERGAAGVVLNNRVVRPLAGSRLVDISYSDPLPPRAQKIASAFAAAFIASNLDKRFQANAYAKVFLEDQLKLLKLRLEESEKILVDFAEKEQIVAVTDKSNIAETNLASANAALGALISERIKNEQLWTQVASAKAINLQQLLTNNVIDGLRAKRNALETERQEKLETFKPSYPAMVQISNKIAEIDRELAAEVNTIKGSLKSAYESSLNQEAEMKKRIEVLRAGVLDLQKRSIQYNILKREADTNRSLYDGLLQRYKEVDVASGVGSNNVFIVDKAELPGSPSSPNMMRALLIALALGLGAGVGAAYLLERLDDTVRTPADLERVTGLTTLGIIPHNEKGKTLEAEFSDPRSHISEASRSLCTALQFSTETGLPKTILISSAAPGEGKSTTGLAMARHFATMGLKVLLIDADLRKPKMHEKLGLSNSIGLTNYLTGASAPPDVIQTTEIPNLAFLASGPLLPNAADLLGSSRMLSLLSIGLKVFDLIVIDGPPVMGLADSPLLASSAAATIFVVGAGQVRTVLLRTAIQRLQFARGYIIGTVITKFDAKVEGGYGYGYGYGQAYGADVPSESPALGMGHARISKTEATG
jgi:succinoglycan biosynthesis transport protein ExoP